MLIEFWERLRGYHTWTETQAVIESATVTTTPVEGSKSLVETQAAETLAWNDLSGQKHTAAFTVPDDSPLFKLAAGATVAIRYNPVQPDRFYLRDLLRARVQKFFLNVLGVLFVLLILAFIALRQWAHLYRLHHQAPLWHW